MMTITIEYWSPIAVHVSPPQTIPAFLYAVGGTKPNYPVPAIPLGVHQVKACWNYDYQTASEVWTEHCDMYDVGLEDIIWPPSG